SDISPLADLSIFKLRELYLNHNTVEDLSPLASLISLRDLRVEDNLINDIGALAYLPALETLLLDDNLISDISPVSGLTKLGKLDPWPTPIEGTIGGPSSVIREGVRVCLGLSGNGISDISPLAQNPGLGNDEGIDLRGSPLSAESLHIYIPQMQANGVEFLYDALPGDANNDGEINALDITKVERIIAGLDYETPGADTNQDGSINAQDITKVERLIAGLD
ncbi:leucine-rich repeat domain-containing protein, partial [Chloroflexota bacterium]